MERYTYMIFKAICFILLTSPLMGQSEIWLKLEKGDAMYLDVTSMKWQPLGSKEKIAPRTYVLTKADATLKIYRETDVYDAPAGGYFYIEDMFVNNKRDLVSAITRIEAEQLPSQPVERTNDQKFGLTYGRVNETRAENQSVPYLTERMRAIYWFEEHQYAETALLSLKRLISKFPSLYFEPSNFDRLCSLYMKLGLYGFLFDETNRFMTLKRDDEFGQMVIRWNETAKKKLTTSGQ